MRKIFPVILATVLAFSVIAQENKEEAVVKEDVKTAKTFGGLNIQVSKALFDNGESDNTDDLFGRIFYGYDVVHGQFQSLFLIAYYPKEFGFEALYDIPQDSVLLKSKTAKLQIWEGWVSFNDDKYINAKIGRFGYRHSNGCYFGNYAENGPTGGLFSRGMLLNGVEFSKKIAPVTTYLIISADDNKINKGSLRLYEKFAMNDMFEFIAGYKINVFDRINDDDAILKHQVDIQAATKPIKDFKLFVDFGLRDLSDDETIDAKFPITIGIDIPTNGILNWVRAEAEYLRKEDRGMVGTKSQGAVFWGVVLEKSFLDHYIFDFALHSDPNGKGEDVVFTSRFTGEF